VARDRALPSTFLGKGGIVKALLLLSLALTACSATPLTTNEDSATPTCNVAAPLGWALYVECDGPDGDTELIYVDNNPRLSCGGCAVGAACTTFGSNNVAPISGVCK